MRKPKYFTAESAKDTEVPDGRVWSEHLQIPLDNASQMLGKPADVFAFFNQQAGENKKAMLAGQKPAGRVFPWDDIQFPPRDLTGINLAGIS